MATQHETDTRPSRSVARSSDSVGTLLAAKPKPLGAEPFQIAMRTTLLLGSAQTLRIPLARDCASIVHLSAPSTKPRTYDLIGT